MKKFNTRLPNKMSSLITAALADLVKTEKDPDYNIDMSTWHSPSPRYDDCSVCLAGCVLAQKGFPRNKKFAPANATKELCKKIFALNSLRCGEVIHAAESLGLISFDPRRATPRQRRNFNRLASPTLDAAYVAPYEVDRTGFKRDMRKLAKRLARLGF